MTVEMPKCKIPRDQARYQAMELITHLYDIECTRELMMIQTVLNVYINDLKRPKIRQRKGK